MSRVEFTHMANDVCSPVFDRLYVSHYHIRSGANDKTRRRQLVDERRRAAALLVVNLDKIYRQIVEVKLKLGVVQKHKCKARDEWQIVHICVCIYYDNCHSVSGICS